MLNEPTTNLSDIFQFRKKKRSCDVDSLPVLRFCLVEAMLSEVQKESNDASKGTKTFLVHSIAAQAEPPTVVSLQPFTHIIH